MKLTSRHLLTIDGGAFVICDHSHLDDTSAEILKALEIGKQDIPFPKYNIPCTVVKTGSDGHFDIEIRKFDFDIKSRIGNFSNKLAYDDFIFTLKRKVTLDIHSGTLLISSGSDEIMMELVPKKYRIEVFSHGCLGQDYKPKEDASYLVKISDIEKNKNY
jgi:hypothetical protein